MPGICETVNLFKNIITVTKSIICESTISSIVLYLDLVHLCSKKGVLENQKSMILKIFLGAST